MTSRAKRVHSFSIADRRAAVRALAAITLLWGALQACAGAPPKPAPATTPAIAPASTTSSPACAGVRFGAEASFALDPVELRQKGAPAHLVQELASDTYRYFRALAPQFALRTCAAFRDVRWHLPVTAIHADAHVEQFVVTSTTSGLEDFDQSGYGPAVVDLVRYAASLHLTCRQAAWPCDADAAVAAYFRSYRASLDRAPLRRPPAIAKRLRDDAPKTPEAWLAMAESLMKPIEPSREARLHTAWHEFQRVQREIRPERQDAFYTIIRAGSLHLGVGSALETKVLMRIRGATDDPNDDLVIEMRRAPPPTGGECAWRPPYGGSLQPLLFMSILGQRMPDTFGVVTLSDDPQAPEFWAQSWEQGYHELSIADLQSQQELIELAEDAAKQLAGHFWTRFPEPLRPVQRRAQLRAFDLVAARALDLAREFAAETVRERTRFRETVSNNPALSQN
jgi:hypothetical protein